MITFIKSQATSLIASLVDFAATFITVEALGVWYMNGTVAGSVSGGVTSFILGRKWVFKKNDVRVHKQAWRYILVWNGSILLNAGGVYGLTQYLGFQYLLSKIIVAATIGFSYNYVLQKKYVFG
jgi:putative flippase GtrA